MGFFDKLKKGLSKTRENITNKIEKLIIGYADIDDDLLDELEEILIMADVGVNTTDKLMEAVRKGIKKKEINTPEDLKPFLQARISEILTTGSDETKVAENGPTVILVIGVNGVGKTTTIGKLASYYQGQGKSVMLAAADTFRAAAIDQLQVWGERTGTKVIAHEEGSDPAAVAFDAVKAAKARNIDVLLIDTAGRLQTKVNLMEELKKINSELASLYLKYGDNILKDTNKWKLVVDNEKDLSGLPQSSIAVAAEEAKALPGGCTRHTSTSPTTTMRTTTKP